MKESSDFDQVTIELNTYQPPSGATLVEDLLGRAAWMGSTLSASTTRNSVSMVNTKVKMSSRARRDGGDADTIQWIGQIGVPTDKVSLKTKRQLKGQYMPKVGWKGMRVTSLRVDEELKQQQRPGRHCFGGAPERLPYV